MYFAVTLQVPAVYSASTHAVAEAGPVGDAGMLVTATFGPGMPLPKNVTVPVGPTELLLWVMTVAVKSTGIAVVTPVDGFAVSDVADCAWVMVTLKSVELGLKLGSPW